MKYRPLLKIEMAYKNKDSRLTVLGFGLKFRGPVQVGIMKGLGEFLWFSISMEFGGIVLWGGLYATGTVEGMGRH